MGSFSFLSESRLRFYGWLTAVLSVVCFLGHFRAGAWLVDGDGRPLQTDFFSLWSAAYQVSHGAPTLAYDTGTIERMWSETFHGLSKYLAFVLPNPPPVLFALAPLGLVPYVPAEIIWIVVGLCLYLAAVWMIVPRSSALAVAAAAPAAWWSAFTVQTGFVTAALIGGFLVLLERRKVAAGAVLGLLVIKPQLGVLFPVVLVAAGEWTAFVSAMMTVVGLNAASLILHGTETWVEFSQALVNGGNLNLVVGIGGWPRLESLYGFIRSIGGSARLAWTCHAAVSAVVSVAVCWLWRRGDISYSTRAAALSLAVFIVTPYLHGYDLVGLAIPSAFLVKGALESGFLRGERTVLVGLFVGSSLFVVLGQPFPVGPIMTVALGTCIAMRARHDMAMLKSSSISSSSSAVGVRS